MYMYHSKTKITSLTLATHYDITLVANEGEHCFYDAFKVTHSSRSVTMVRPTDTLYHMTITCIHFVHANVQAKCILYVAVS